MKKTAFALGAIVAVGGAYAANTFLVNKIAMQVPVQVEKSIAAADKDMFDIKTLSSNVDGNHVSQKFAIYMIDEGEKYEVPLYVNHDVYIGYFGMDAKGAVTLPKDKGLSAEFIKNVTTFNEKIDYTYTVATKEVDLVSSINFDQIQEGIDKKTDIGVMNFLFKGNKEKNSGSLDMEHLQFTQGNNIAFNVDKLNLAFTNTQARQDSDFSINGISFKDSETQEDYDIKGVKIISNLNFDNDTASVKNDWKVDSLTVKSPYGNLPSSKLGILSKVDGIDISKAKEINQALASQDEEKLMQLMTEVLTKGAKISDINIYMNDSNITGFIDLNPADYNSAASGEEMVMLASQNITSELNVKITKKLLTTLNVPVEFVAPILVGQYQFNEDEDKFTALLKLAKGQASINDKMVY